MAATVLNVVVAVMCMTSSVYGATAPSFMCATTSVCNLESDRPDQYCTSGTEGRCKSCADEASRCFSELMAFNCTNYCRELDKGVNLKMTRERPCPAVGSVRNGQHNASDSPRRGDIVKLTCHVGYTFDGNGIIRCLEFGIWSGALPDCTAISKQDQTSEGDTSPIPTPSTPQCPRPRGAPATAVGESIGYACDTGYVPEENRSRALCLSDGTWRAATCHQMVYTCKTDAVWVVVAIGSLVVNLVTVIAFTLTCLKVRRDRKKENVDQAHRNRKDYKLVPDIEASADSGITIEDGQTSLSNNHLPIQRDNSLPSTASYMESTDRKEVPGTNRLSSADDSGNARGNESKRSSSRGSDVNVAGNMINLVQVVNVINNANNTNRNNNNNNNNNNSSINNSSNNNSNSNSNSNNNINSNIKSNSSINNSNNNKTNKTVEEDAGEDETDNSPDHTPFPKQATGEGSTVDNYEWTHQGGNSDNNTGNPDTGPAFANVGPHAQPTDDGKAAKLALPNNTISHVSELKVQLSHMFVFGFLRLYCTVLSRDLVTVQ